ncbi:MAG: hypothetical protein GKR89_01610 [Candidatus Latescibacteria bacterium]|nr:hypothetical protein [Candidatus Latescibacterota bacterium]
MRGWRLVFLGLALGLAHCGHYSTTAGMVGGIRSMAVPIALNDTPEPDIGELLTERAEQACTEDGQLRLVDEESADALLQLRIISLEDRPFTYTADEQTQQYRFALWVEAELVKSEGGKALLKLDRVEGWGTYDADTADEEEGGRGAAIEAALDMVLEEVVNRSTSSW